MVMGMHEGLVEPGSMWSLLRNLQKRLVMHILGFYRGLIVSF